MSDLVSNVTAFLAFYLPALVLLSGLCVVLVSIVTHSFRVFLMWAVLIAVPVGIRGVDLLSYYQPVRHPYWVVPSRPEQEGQNFIV